MTFKVTTFPHLNSAANHILEAKKSSFWLGHIVLSLLLAIPLLGRLIHLVESCYKKYLPSFNASTPASIREKTTPIDEKKDLTASKMEDCIDDPLALSDEDIALFISGIFVWALNTTQFSTNLDWIRSTLKSSIPSMLKAGIFTTPTSPMTTCLAALSSYMTATQNEEITTDKTINLLNNFFEDTPKKRQPFNISKFGKLFAEHYFAPAPIQTTLQTYKTGSQIYRATTQIYKNLSYLTEKNPLLIGRNILIHSFNIGISSYYLIRSAAITFNELPYYKTWALDLFSSGGVSNELQAICPAYLHLKTESYFSMVWQNLFGTRSFECSLAPNDMQEFSIQTNLTLIKEIALSLFSSETSNT